jgi:hypothetical protein
MFFENKTFEHWVYTLPTGSHPIVEYPSGVFTTGANYTGGFADPTWVLSGTVYGDWMAYGGSEANRNDMTFGAVKRMMYFDYTYLGRFKFYDEIVDPTTRMSYNIVNVQDFNNVLPHVELMMGDTQWLH